jgi:iron complex outermembrane receptor protein
MNVQHTKGILAVAIGAICSANAPTALAQVAATKSGAVDEILVYGTQGARDSVTASRLDLTLLQTPATVDVIDGDAIRARLDGSVLEAVTRSAGFTNEANPGNGNSSIAARGFRGQGAVTKLYDGTNYYTASETTTFPFDTWGVERVEVLKGPSSVLYGEGGIGGAINIIPRKPERERSGDVRVLMGENDTTFLGLDFTGPLSDSVAYRIDYSNSQSDNWVFNGDSEAEMFSAALRWDVSDKLALSARYDRGDQSPMRYFGVPVARRDEAYGDTVPGTFGGDFIEAFKGSNFNVSDSDLNYQDDSIRLEADWRASDTVSVQAQIFNLTSDRHWKNAEVYFLLDANTLERWEPLELGHELDHTGARMNVLFEPSDGAISGSVGFEVNDVSAKFPNNFGGAHNPTGITFDEFDTVNPNNFQPGTFAGIAGPAPDVLNAFSDVSQWSVFGEGRFKATDKLAIVAALRYDDYDTTYTRVARSVFNQQVDSVTGRLGLVFDVSDDTALYAQYGTGASHPNGTVVNIDSSLRQADMIESEQTELGIKHQIAGTGLQFNVALFDITMNNLTIDDPNSADPTDVILIDEQTSQGVEVGFTYAASQAFQVYGNVAALNAETNTGETPTNTPENTYNLGVAWSIADAVNIIADARYVGERTVGLPTPIPSYTVVDASAHWNVSKTIGLVVKVDNIFDELYATATYQPDQWMVGRPRTASLAFDWRF